MSARAAVSEGWLRRADSDDGLRLAREALQLGDQTTLDDRICREPPMRRVSQQSHSLRFHPRHAREMYPKSSGLGQSSLRP